MLKKISIDNLLIIEKIKFSVQAGMSVITGETGAGKSVLIQAINLIRGQRAEKRWIRAGCDQARIRAEFVIPSGPLLDWLRQYGGDSQLCIERIINRRGRNQIRFNQKTISLRDLKRIGQRLIHIHGQYEQSELNRPAFQLELLDHYAGHSALLDEIKQAYQSLENIRSALANSMANKKKQAEEMDYLSFQLEEIAPYRLSKTAFQALEQKIKYLSHIDQIKSQLNKVFELLSAEPDLISRLYRAQNILHAIEPLSNSAQLLDSARIQIEEALFELRQYGNDLNHSPAELAEMEQKMNRMQALARKHRVNADQLNQVWQKLHEQYQAWQALDDQIASLTLKQKKIEQDYQNKAQIIRANRQKAAQKLSTQISQIMQELGMKGGRFNIEVRSQPASHQGMDRVEFLVQINPGQSLSPLAQSVSGGELSRISLAIQACTAHLYATPILIFDEVDSGTGGAIAEKIGLLLKKISRTHQVICITHLPQVAAQAEHHFLIKKYHRQNATYNQIQVLDFEQRISEIARMLSGHRIHQKTLAHAAELLNTC